MHHEIVIAHMVQFARQNEVVDCEGFTALDHVDAMIKD